MRNLELLRDSLLTSLVKITLNSPRARRASIADSIDLLFAARSQAVETWHTDVLRRSRSTIKRSRSLLRML